MKWRITIAGCVLVGIVAVTWSLARRGETAAGRLRAPGAVEAGGPGAGEETGAAMSGGAGEEPVPQVAEIEGAGTVTGSRSGADPGSPTAWKPPGAEELAIIERRIENSTLLNEDVAGIAADEIRTVRFMQLRMSGHEVELLASEPVEGRPRRTRATFPLEKLTPGVLVRALDNAGRIVWQDVIQDPTVFRCCYEHADEARLTGFTQVLDEAFFGVRVPDLPVIAEVTFHRHPRPVHSLRQVATEQNLLGRFKAGD